MRTSRTIFTMRPVPTVGRASAPEPHRSARRSRLSRALIFLGAITPLSVAPQPSLGSSYASFWRVSRSATDPFDHQGPPQGGSITLYLWLECVSGFEMRIAEFGLGGTIQPTQFTASPGITNSGSATDMLLTFGDCRTFFDPVLVGTILATEPAEGGQLCLEASSVGNSFWHWCFDDLFGTNSFAGYSSIGVPCEDGPGCSALEPIISSSWADVKSKYR